MSGLYLVADDLTGALDSAVAFSARYGPIPVYLEVPWETGGAHVAVNLDTREATEATAVRRSAEVAQHLVAAGISFKKIDSLLRGPWAAELAALLREGTFRSCVFAPAFPSQGRITRKGRQVLRAADRTEHLLAVDPMARMIDAGLNVARALPEAFADAAPTADAAWPGVQVRMIDAETDDDLRAVVRAASRLPEPVLWCGSGGLARALARQEPKRVEAVHRPILAIIGTEHPVSQAQISYAAARVPLRQVITDGDAAKAATAIARAVGLTGSALLTFALPRRMSAPAAAASIGLQLSSLLPLVARPQTLVIAGGQTLLSVCRALGASRLEVDAEFTPGIPHSRMTSRIWSGIEVISKSGAFGDATILHRLLETHAWPNAVCPDQSCP